MSRAPAEAATKRHEFTTRSAERLTGLRTDAAEDAPLVRVWRLQVSGDNRIALHPRSAIADGRSRASGRTSRTLRAVRSIRCVMLGRGQKPRPSATYSNPSRPGGMVRNLRPGRGRRRALPRDRSCGHKCKCALPPPPVGRARPGGAFRCGRRAFRRRRAFAKGPDSNGSSRSPARGEWRFSKSAACCDWRLRRLALDRSAMGQDNRVASAAALVTSAARGGEDRRWAMRSPGDPLESFLPPRLEQIVSDEVRADERVLWQAQPIPGLYARRA